MPTVRPARRFPVRTGSFLIYFLYLVKSLYIHIISLKRKIKSYIFPLPPSSSYKIEESLFASKKSLYFLSLLSFLLLVFSLFSALSEFTWAVRFSQALCFRLIFVKATSSTVPSTVIPCFEVKYGQNWCQIFFLFEDTQNRYIFHKS